MGKNVVPVPAVCQPTLLQTLKCPPAATSMAHQSVNKSTQDQLGELGGGFAVGDLHVLPPVLIP